jgi:hypothetical protein
MNWIILLIVVAAGAIGGFVNVFIGDSGLHLPTIENGVFRPGFVGVIFIGGVAALTAWASGKAYVLIGSPLDQIPLETSDIARGILIGFGGAKWFKSELEKDVFQKAASIAASKNADPAAAATIGSSSPFTALETAMKMK